MKIPIVCHLCDFGPEVPGSFVDSMLYLAHSCRHQMNIETFFIFPERARKRSWLNRFDKQCFPYGFVPRKRNIIFEVRNLMNDYNPLIFHTHFSQFDIPALLLRFFYRQSKVVWHYHNEPGLTKWQRIKDVIKIRGLGGYFVNKFIAVGELVYFGLINAGLPEQKVTLVYNGIDTNRFLTDEFNRQNARNSLGIPDGYTVFLLLGWEPQTKGIDVFIKAAQEILRNEKNKAIFVIVGMEETRKVVSGIFQKSSFHKAIRVIDPVADFPFLLSGVDIFVSCSRSEGSPYAVLEAMSAKKIILSSNITIPVVSGRHGRAEGVLVYPTENWISLSGYMEQCLEMDQITRAALGSVNYEHVQAFYSVEIWAEKIRKIYLSLL